MTEKLKGRNFPNLRFPGFEEDIGNFFKKHSFKDIFLFSTGKNIKQNEASPEFKIPCVRYGELYHMYNEVIKEVINKTNLDKSELFFSQGDEILLPSAGEDPLDIGLASALTIANVAIGRTINILKPINPNVYSQIYVSYYINHKLRRKISTLAKGSSISNVYNSDLKTLYTILPNIDEQEKIASFISLLDERITTQKKIIEGLIVRKNSISKKISNQKLSFVNTYGKKFPDWEKKKIKEIFDITRGNVLSMSLVNPNPNRSYIYPVYSSQTKNNGLSGYFDDFLFEDCITWTTDGAGAGDVNFRKGKFYCTNVCGVLKNKEGYSNLFIAEILNSISRKHVSYVGNPKLMNNVMAEILINIPQSFEEQDKISKFLSLMERKIKIENNLLAQYKLQKKYLLSNLFV